MPSHVERPLEHFRTNRDQHMEDLKKLVRIPSVSFDGFPPEEVRRSAEATAQLLRERGFENVRLLELRRTMTVLPGRLLDADELAEGRGGLVEDGDALFAAEPIKVLRRARDQIRHDDAAALLAQCPAILNGWIADETTPGRCND